MEIIEINTDNYEAPAIGEDLYSNRTTVINTEQAAKSAEVTIWVQGYNDVETTRACVSSILKNTKGIDYELILVDNGSSDESLAFFKSVEYDKKKIIHITKNIGPTFSQLNLSLGLFNRYSCFIPSDVIVTSHWLDNMLTCIRSDPKIGMVVAASSNVSNLQQVDLPYKNNKEMQEQAEKYNVSDPKKWEERLRLVTLATLYRKEALFAIGWPLTDVGFFHDFADDDVSFRVRRAGYKAVFAGDTWLCHNHDYTRAGRKTPEQFRESLEIGRQNFSDKYFGVDAWDDVNNFYLPYFQYFPPMHFGEKVSVLGVNVRCGTPILDIKNLLRKSGIFDVELSAFCEEPKYWLDLKTICSGNVVCDRDEFLINSFELNSFDVIMTDKPINYYRTPNDILCNMFRLCKPGGYIICRLENSYSVRDYMHILGDDTIQTFEMSYNISRGSFVNIVGKYGKILTDLYITEDMSEGDSEVVKALIPANLSRKQRELSFENMMWKERIFLIQKTANG